MKNLLIIFVLTLAMIPFLGFAQEGGTYVPLAPLPGFVGDKDGNVNTTDLSGYLDGMFKIGIALCTGLAVIMIVIGGVQYLSTDAWTKKEEGLEKVKAALAGLLIALGSWLIINTINPDFLNFSLGLN